MKRYILFAGVNGSGKSTLYQTRHEISDMSRINTDEILREFGSWKNKDDIMKAGKLAVMRFEEYIKQGISFNQETTLCGNAIFRMIERAKDQGYRIELHYVSVESVEVAKERIAMRVLKGGHGIPDKDVERRYLKSIENLNKVIPMCDLTSIYDNTNQLRRIAIYKGSEIVRESKTLPNWYINGVKDK